MRPEFPLWFLCFPALFGLACGSFLNVCIVRVPADQSVVRPRSRCPQCGTPLRAWQNLPILSWIILRGRCRSCRKPIPLFYPLVELAVAAWFVFCTFQFATGHFGAGLAAGIVASSQALLGWLLIGLMVMDARDGLLPDAFTLGGSLMGILLLAASTVSLPVDMGIVMATTPEKIVLLRLLSVIIVTVTLLLLRWLYRRLRHRNGMGLGDVKMTAMLAAFLGLPLTALAFLIASIIGSLYAALLILRPRAKTAGKPNSVPFGCFLALGGFYALLLGESTIHWYLKFFF